MHGQQNIKFNISFSAQNTLSQVLVLRQTNPGNTFMYYFNAHFNIQVDLWPCLTSRLRPPDVSDNILYVFQFPHICASHLPSF